MEMDALDPSPDMMQLFGENVVDRFPDVDFKLHITTLEEFVDREHNSNFDLITCLHVVYCIKDVTQYITKYMRLMSPKGMFLIMQQTRGNITDLLCNIMNYPVKTRDIPNVIICETGQHNLVSFLSGKFCVRSLRLSGQNI